MENPRLQTLIENIVFTQSLAIYYISLMKEVDPKKVFIVEGKELNSLYWLVGHIAWAENMLALEGTHGVGVLNEKLNSFKFGDQHTVDLDISFSDLKFLAKEVHQETMNHLYTLKDSDLDLPNAKRMSFGKEPTNQLIILHFIRHLGTHVGHLGWLCKMHGIKTV